MKTKRAIGIGALIWLFIFSLFAILVSIPEIKDSYLKQGLIVGMAIVPFAWYGASLYYKKGHEGHGLSVALVMVGTAMVLDALITVPLFEKPYHDVDHATFFTNPLLWILVAENIIVIYTYWKFKINQK